MFNQESLLAIFNRTNGHCHFCGDPLQLQKYGCKDIEDLRGAWEADHVIQRGKGGKKEAENCLPACVRCNRLRWHRKGKNLRELLLLGLIAKDEIKKSSSVGNTLKLIRARRLMNNKKRRRKSFSSSISFSHAS